MSTKELFEKIAQAVLDGEVEEGRRLCREALGQGLPALEILDQGFVPGMERIGRLYEDGDAFLPELVQAAEVMKSGMALLGPHLSATGEGGRGLGRVLMGTVAGDIHDIGKSIVSSLLSANGFTVRDLGTQVALETFIAEVRAFAPDILGLSALITTTMPEQRRVIERLVAEGLRPRTRVIVGGAPVTEEWARQIGADAYGEDALAAVRVCKRLMGAAS
jgi:corrinoid protein of di/trimethylamine methyltransferase